MTTEILSIFIVIGVLIVVAVRWQMRERQHDEVEDLETSAEKIRYKMEHSADEIIARMTTHIDRLETLVALADERANRLEAQIKELKAEQDVQRTRHEESARLLEDMGRVDAVERVERTDATEFSQLLDASMANLHQADEGYYAAEEPRQQSMREWTSAPAESISQMIPPVQYPAPAEQLPPQGMAPVMQPVPPVAQQTEVYHPQQEYAAPEHIDSRTVEERQRAQEALRQGNVSPAVQARRLLAQGYSVEDVARQVHMGRSAVELIREMLEGQK